MKYTLKPTSKFQKDLKRIQKRGAFQLFCRKDFYE